MQRRDPSRFVRSIVWSLAACGALAACGSGSGGAPVGAMTISMPHSVVAKLAAGFQHSLAPSANGIVAWGDNASGELGDGSGQRHNTPVPVLVPTHSPVVAVAAGSTHSLALTDDGTVWAFGHNRSGQLGDGTKNDHLRPERLRGLHDVRAIATGAGFSMALEADGSVWAWGNNQSGQLGDGHAPIDHANPAMVYGLHAGSGVIGIAAGDSFALVLKQDGTVLAWGNGTSGQLGDGRHSKASAPTPVIGLGRGSGVIDIAAGGAFSLALRSDGTVLAWGHNTNGQLGDATAPADHATPVKVFGFGPQHPAAMISAGFSFALALDRKGALFAWGNNQSGQLGDNNAPNDRHAPVRVPLAPAIRAHGRPVAVACGGSHSLMVMNDGTVLSWGNNSHGQLGDGTAPTDHHTPVVVFAKGTP
jgi:alpha-tubulin suppressor-like RCC1 family protein